MTTSDIKLAINSGVKLELTEIPGLSHATVLDFEKRFELTWDRFNRLFHTAKAIQSRVPSESRILDVGGFDGALALFLKGYSVDVIDPVTTGGSGLSLPFKQYPVVVSVDAIEHIEPSFRKIFLQELARVTAQFSFINFPSQRTAKAQELVFSLTSNPLIEEHVIWQLPNGQDVSIFLQEFDFHTEIIEHTSLSQWVSQYVLQSLAPETSNAVNSYLLQEHLLDPQGMSLYDLVIATKIRSK